MKNYILAAALFLGMVSVAHADWEDRSAIEPTAQLACDKATAALERAIVLRCGGRRGGVKETRWGQCKPDGYSETKKYASIKAEFWCNNEDK